MKLSRMRRQRFNMAQYEHLEIEAAVEFEIDDDAGEEDIAAAAADAEETLTVLLAADIDRADRASKTPEDSTYLHDWKDAQ